LDQPKQAADREKKKEVEKRFEGKNGYIALSRNNYTAH